MADTATGSSFSSRARSSCGLPALGPKLALLIGAALVACGAFAGSSGCLRQSPWAKMKQDGAQKEQQKKKKKPKKDFEVAGLAVQPSDGTISRYMVKPGHWITATQPMRANNFDFQADIQSCAVDQRMNRIAVPRTRFRMEMWRPASLPKGQIKHFEMTYFIPRPRDRDEGSVWLESRLRARRTGREVLEIQAEKTIRLPDYQYLFVVLSSDPDRYGYLKRLDSITPPSASFAETDRIEYYRVILPRIERQVALPAYPLTWTSIAYLLWDDLSPTLLTPDQAQAMLDWLHWGGQLIISGPNSLDALRGSFLEAYLPAQKVNTVRLGPEAFEQMNQYWSFPEQTKTNRGAGRRLTVREGKPLVGVRLRKHPAARYLPHTGKLAIERQVGRGRMVVTAFHLADRPVVNWAGYDGFFNACLLRRPRRLYRRSAELSGPELTWADYPEHLKDARLISTLRYFSRDMGPAVSEAARRARGARPGRGAGVALARGAGPTAPSQTADAQPNMELDPWHFGGYGPEPLSGIAGWDDGGSTARAARRSLKEAAGISIPGAGFVARVLAVYLLLLVPVNWGFFRLLGRVQWAWIAAPAIAVLGAVAVVRMAQLDIGFARSRTEIAVLEAHGGYRRAHLTRYTALYTSLSSSYELTFTDPSALARPFATDPRDRRPVPEALSTVRLRRDSGVRLQGLKVRSNSTGIVHSEQMFDLGGAFELIGDEARGFRLANRTQLTLKEVGVLHRTVRGKLQTAWVGTLRPNRSLPLRFGDAPGNRPQLPQWEQSPTMTTSGRSVEGEVNLGRLVRLATDQLRMGNQEVRLIGWTGDELPGLSIRPRASQTVLRTLVLAHLRPAALPAPERDANCRADVTPPERRTTADPGYDPFGGAQD